MPSVNDLSCLICCCGLWVSLSRCTQVVDTDQCRKEAGNPFGQHVLCVASRIGLFAVDM